nr:L-fucose transporter [Raoultella sp. NCTC 9187]
MIIVAIVLLVAVLIALTKFPSLQSDDHVDSEQSSLSASFARLVRIRHWRWAVLAQFCYVGAQTACWSYLIRYAIEEIPGMTPGFAANYLTGTMVCFFIAALAVPGLSAVLPRIKCSPPMPCCRWCCA